MQELLYVPKKNKSVKIFFFLTALILTTAVFAEPHKKSTSQSRASSGYNVPAYKLTTSFLLGFYELIHIMQQYSPAMVGRFAFFPTVTLKMGKGNLQELVDTKTLCGTMIFGGKAISDLLKLTGASNADAILPVIFLTPTLLQPNQPVNYGKADLNTVLTIFSAKTSIKLIEDILRQQGLSYSQSGSLLILAAIPIWHNGMTNNRAPAVYLWFALPKLLISAGFAQSYKGLQPDGWTGPLFAGGAAYALGSVFSLQTAKNWIPEYAGLTPSAAGKMKKLLGYGLADSMVKVIRETTILPDGLKRPVTHGVLYYATIKADALATAGILPELTLSLRRGLVVKYVLFKIESALLLGYWVLPLIFEPEMPSIMEIGAIVDLDDIPEDDADFCLAFPVPGIATSTYQYSCYDKNNEEVESQQNDEIPWFSDAQWLLSFLIR